MPGKGAFRYGFGTGPRTLLGTFPVPDPSLSNFIFDDFDRFPSPNWEVDAVGATTSVASIDRDGGFISLVVDDSVFDNYLNINWTGDSGGDLRTVVLNDGKRWAMGLRGAYLGPENSSLIAGLFAAPPLSANPLTSANGVYLTITQTGVTPVLRVNSAFSVLNAVQIPPFPVSTTELGTVDLVYDGAAKLTVYINRGVGIELKGPGGVDPLFPSVPLFPCLQMGLGIGDDPLVLDYFYFIKER